jgi:uncharacterized cupin superfamily protein
VRSFNLFDGELDLARDRPGFSWRRAMLGEQLGGKRLGASLYELEPGERTFPYHYEYGAEEWLLVVAGPAHASRSRGRARVAARRRGRLRGRPRGRTSDP